MAHTEHNIKTISSEMFNPNDLEKILLEPNKNTSVVQIKRAGAFNVKKSMLQKYCFLEVNKKTGWGRIHIQFTPKKKIKWNKDIIASIPKGTYKPVGFMEMQCFTKDDNTLDENVVFMPINNTTELLNIHSAVDYVGVPMCVNLYGYFIPNK